MKLVVLSDRVESSEVIGYLWVTLVLLKKLDQSICVFCVGTQWIVSFDSFDDINENAGVETANIDSHEDFFLKWVSELTLGRDQSLQTVLLKQYSSLYHIVLCAFLFNRVSAAHFAN